jgi:hypothetical protein
MLFALEKNIRTPPQDGANRKSSVDGSSRILRQPIED